MGAGECWGIIRLIDTVECSPLGGFGVHIGLHVHERKVAHARAVVHLPDTQGTMDSLEHPVVLLPKFGDVFFINVWPAEVRTYSVHLTVAQNLFFEVWQSGILTRFCDGTLGFLCWSLGEGGSSSTGRVPGGGVMRGAYYHFRAREGEMGGRGRSIFVTVWGVAKRAGGDLPSLATQSWPANFQVPMGSVLFFTV